MAVRSSINSRVENEIESVFKKGAEANVSTQEVHDRQMEKKLYQLRTRINIGNWIVRKYIRYSCIAIDLRDFLKNTL